MSVQVDILPHIIARIDLMLAADPWCSQTTHNDLGLTFGSKYSYANGTYELAIAGLRVTNTAGDKLILRAWQAKARRHLREEAR